MNFWSRSCYVNDVDMRARRWKDQRLFAAGAVHRIPEEDTHVAWAVLKASRLLWIHRETSSIIALVFCVKGVCQGNL